MVYIDNAALAKLRKDIDNLIDITEPRASASGQESGKLLP
jgi:hypothetical protein